MAKEKSNMMQIVVYRSYVATFWFINKKTSLFFFFFFDSEGWLII